jgi:ATP-dependent Clp protease adaptor protein ClpS
MNTTKPEVQIETNTKISPRWNVILLDDPDHTFAYVTELIVSIFKRNLDDARALTEEVHRMGKAIVITCSKERAELYREQVLNYGNDPFMKIFQNKESGALGCVIEPAE